MKRIFLFVAVAAAALSLGGCQRGGGGNAEPMNFKKPDGADDGAFVSADSGAETPLPDFDIGTDEIREDSRFYEEIMEDEEDAERRGE